MHGIDGWNQLDLNLLRTLWALLDERSVTRAARRLGLTQPTVSHALSRLRRLLGDPLLVRSGRGMAPTPRAEAMAPALGRALGDLARALTDEARFEPARSSRSFALLCPDLLAPLLPRLLRRIGAEAPGVRLEVRPPAPGVDAEGALASGAFDAALGPAREAASGLLRRVLGKVSWCVLARRGHPGVRRGKLTREAWLRYPHVLVATGERSQGFVGRALAAEGAERRISLVAPSFLAAPLVVAQTDLFFAAPRELMADLAEQLGLLTLDPPARLPPVPVALLWHERLQADGGHRWLRELLASVVAEALR